MTFFLKHLEQGGDIYLRSYRVMDLSQTVLDLERGASKVGLEINTNKIEVLNLTGHRILPICINGQSIEGSDQFIYLGSVVFPDGDTELDVTRRINSD